MFPNTPIAMVQESSAEIPFSWKGVYYHPEGFRTGWWIGNQQFGGYPLVGQNWTSRPHVEAYGRELLHNGNPAAIVDVEQWAIGHFIGVNCWHDIPGALMNLVAWLRPYAKGPILFADYWAGQAVSPLCAAKPFNLTPQQWNDAWLTDDYPDRREVIADWFEVQRPMWELAGCAMAWLGQEADEFQQIRDDQITATRVMLDALAPDLPLYVWTDGCYGDETLLSSQDLARTLNVIAAARATPVLWGRRQVNAEIIHAIQKAIL